ncbi:MAG: PLP-dependent aminotransferase family protein [Gammaproteobacteria bacterium]|nr:PLP-dependent aminotransferase family protein [Gammaproteobacteria bacterium]
MKLPLSDIHTITLKAGKRDPLHKQLYEAVREAILNGKFPAGAQLPSSRIFAQTLAVSRNTVVSAFDQLQAEGYIESRVGAGSFVTSTTPESQLHASRTTPLPALTMTSRLSRRGQRLASSSPRQAGEAFNAFAPGTPELKQFPRQVWARLLSRHARDTRLLSYSASAGYAPLRETLADYLQACRAVQCTSKQVLITCGAQQALDLCSRLLIDEGDPVWIEEPGYPGARGALLAAGAQLIPVPVDHEGICIDAIRGRAPRPRLIYISPSHQYPSGTTLSLQRRLQLLEFAHQERAWIIEDDYDSEFRYHGRPLASIQGLAANANVIYIGTLSKVLVPAIRLGYMVVPKNLIAAFEKARSFVDTHPPTVTQAALDDFIREGYFASHIRRMRNLYATRQAILSRALKQHLHEILTHTPRETGMHLTAYAKTPLDDQAIAAQAAQIGLQLRPLSSYFIGPDQQSGFVLGYAGFDKDELIAGVEQLRQLLKGH